MNFLGEANTGSGVTPEQEEKLDAITVEPSGEVKFDNGIIVNGGATELKTTITEVDDPILQINRSNTAVTSGITIKNTDDGKYSSIIKSGNDYYFTENTISDDTLAPTANILCGNVNNVNISQLNTDYELHRLETSIHAQLDDNSVLNDTIWSSQKISQELKANEDQSNLILNDWITNNFEPHINDLSIHRPLDDLQTTTTNLWSASKISTEISANAGAIIDDVTPANDKVYSSSKTQNIVNGVQNNLTTHTTDLNIHRPVSDGLISTTSLWSSQKTANEIQNVNTALGLHTTNNAIHAELNDALQTNTNLWSASKIASEITASTTVIDDVSPAIDKVYSSSKTQTIVNDVQTNITNHINDATVHFTIDDTNDFVDKVYSSSKTQTELNTLYQKDADQDNVITNLETSATRALIQDSTGVTKIELSGSKLTSISDEHSFVYNEPSGATQTYQPVWSAARISGSAIGLANNDTVANLTSSNVQRAVLGRADQDFTLADVPRVIRFQINSANARAVMIGIVNITDSGLPIGVNIVPQPYHCVISGYNTPPSTDWAAAHYNVFTVNDINNDLFPSSDTPAFQNGDIIKFDIDALGNVTISQEFTSGLAWEVNPPVGQLQAGKVYSVLAWDFSGVISDANIQLLEGQEPSSGVTIPVEKINVGNTIELKAATVIDGNTTINSNLEVVGNLTVTGITTTVNTDNITIEDPLIKLANNNITNVTNIGFIGQYNDGLQKYSGLMQTYNNNDWHLIGGTTQVPTEAVLPVFNDAELGTLNLNKARLTQVLPRNGIQGISLFNEGVLGIQEVKITNASIDFTNYAFNVNAVQQDTKVSAFGQYYVDFSLTSPFSVLLNPTYASAFAIPPSYPTGANVGFNSSTNTFTIQHPGWYRCSYHISIRNIDNDNTFVQATLRKNGIQGDAFELQSATRHLRQRNRVTTLSTTFIHEMVLNDTVRMFLEAITDAGLPGNENIDVFDVNVNIERMRVNF